MLTTIVTPSVNRPLSEIPYITFAFLVLLRSPNKMGSSNPTQIQQLLTPLRELITDKPPYVNGTLQLPASCFSLFYRTTEDGPDARFEHEDPEFLGHREWEPLTYFMIDVSTLLMLL